MPQPVPQVERTGGLARWAFAAVAAHLLLGVARVPGVVIGRRLADVDDYQRRGAVRFFLDTEHRGGADVVEWIRAHVPDAAAVLYRGDSKGAIEFAPALLAPRLLVAEGLCPDDAVSWAGRPLARRPASDGGRILVIAASDDGLRLETR